MIDASITEYNLAFKAIYRGIERSFSIKRVEIEVIVAIHYVTIEKGLECSVRSAMDYLIGGAEYDCYKIVNKLVSEGYIDNTGKRGHNRRFYLSLTDKGKELINSINRGFERQIQSFRDNKALKKNKINIRVKKKVEGGGSAPLALNGGDESK